MGGLLALTVLVFEQYLFSRWTFRWDFLGAYTTTPAFVAASIGSGHILSWSPFVASGFPVGIDPQAGLYYPGWWLLGGLGIPATLRVLTAVQIAHVLFGAVGVLALARARRLGWSWATLAATAYLFFGGFYGESEHADFVRGFAYAPWLLWSLTPPQDGSGWTRLAALPALVWLTVSGAYPGQIVSFGITGFVYVSVALRAGGRELWRRHRAALALAVIAAGAICIVVLAPYQQADHAHELHRVMKPTAFVRAGASFSLRDLLGLYLNDFAWRPDATITTWAVGIPVLIGCACVRRETLCRQAPLVACGAAALALAMTPKIGFVGRAMVTAGPLFPSRFPAADYKAIVAVALVIVAAESWSLVRARRAGLPWRALLAGCVLVGAALLAPWTYAQPTRVLWLVVLVALACVALTLVRVPARVLVCLLLALVAIDGVREIRDYRYLGRISPWRTSPAEAAPFRARDVFVRKLPAQLSQAPGSRPARIPAAVPFDRAPTGNPFDAVGWVADGYHLIDYGGTIENKLWQAEQSAVWTSMLLAPWHGYTFPCAVVGCGGSGSSGTRLPSPSSWRPSPAVRTLSYGVRGVVYAVNTTQPVLMVENELGVSGWRADTPKVRPVNVGIPLRAWRLAAGNYRFTATYRSPSRGLQQLAALVALLAWLGCAFALSRKRRARRREPAARPQ
ncbi:MAG TPA: hypothetical protein VLJ42_10530 [Solirubrobacteraceae bacterium]|nr:hypothetical protein [Solirubrobacteraceae bacterium]